MSAINPITNSATGYIPPIAVDSTTSSSATNFSRAMAAASPAPTHWLTSPEQSLASRPNVKEFMDKSGAEFLDASEFIYGVVGSNTDVRDWAAIMASSDPISAARQATAQMYGRTSITPRTDANYMGSTDTLAKDGNFAVRLLKDEDNKVLDQGLKLVDAQGLILRDAGNNPQSIQRNSWLFGFDTQPLANLVQAANTLSPALADAVKVASANVESTSAGAVPPAPAVTPVSSADPIVAVSPPSISLAASTSSAPAMTAQAPQESSTLAQAIEQAASSAVSFVDSNSYLSSLFKA